MLNLCSVNNNRIPAETFTEDVDRLICHQERTVSSWVYADATEY